MSDFIDEYHKAVNAWADDLGLDGDERDGYIEFHMEKRGYQRATTWTPPEPEEGEKGASMFSKRKAGAPAGKRQQQRTGGQGGAGGPAGQYFRS